MDNPQRSCKEHSLVNQLLTSAVSKPDYQGALGRAGKRITENKLRAVVLKEKALGIKMIRLSNGIPCPDPLPIVGAQFTLRDGTVIKMDQNDMDTMSAYGDSPGLPELIHWLTELTRVEHKPPQLEIQDHPEPFDLNITNGSTDATRGIFHIMLDEGDFVLLENNVYSTTIGQLKLFGVDPVTVDSDEQGMIAEHLESILASWSKTHPNSKRPRLLFAITSCNNPTSYTWHEERLAAVYFVCRKYDVIILEDGAYYFLQFGQRRRSFQSLDVDGRVVRMDTFAKLIGAGYRLGWVSGPSTIISRYMRSMSQNTIHANFLTQMLVSRILHQWGHERFQVEVKLLSEDYKKRAQLMVKALEKYCTGLATWSFPSGGMFLWVKINDLEDTRDLMDRSAKAGVSIISGEFFKPVPGPSPYIRLSYSAVPDDDVDKAIRILADLLRQK